MTTLKYNFTFSYTFFQIKPCALVQGSHFAYRKTAFLFRFSIKKKIAFDKAIFYLAEKARFELALQVIPELTP